LHGIDKSSPVPLYHQLKEVLREHIKLQIWKPGDIIPSEEQLCKEYGISRGPVRQALGELVREGFLSREHGRGTFVAEPKFEQGLMSFYSIFESTRDSKMKAKSNVLQVTTEVADPKIAKRLEIVEGDEIIRLVRIRFLDGYPLILEKCHIVRKYCPDIVNQDLSERSLYGLLRSKYNIVLSKETQTFEPVLADKYEASILQIEPGDPVLLLENTTHMLDDKPILFSKMIVRGDRCRFFVELFQ
jgi:GntR family transcriptional regulator